MRRIEAFSGSAASARVSGPVALSSCCVLKYATPTSSGLGGTRDRTAVVSAKTRCARKPLRLRVHRAEIHAGARDSSTSAAVPPRSAARDVCDGERTTSQRQVLPTARVPRVSQEPRQCLSITVGPSFRRPSFSFFGMGPLPPLRFPTAGGRARTDSRYSLEGVVSLACCRPATAPSERLDRLGRPVQREVTAAEVNEGYGRWWYRARAISR